jgi:hypothetical protein
LAKLATLIFIYTDICIALGFYVYLLRIKKRIGFQLGMNISMVMGGMTAMLAGVLLISQEPFHFIIITVISTFIGLGIGAWSFIRLSNICDWVYEWDGHWDNVSDDWNGYRNAVRVYPIHSRVYSQSRFQLEGRDVNIDYHR